MASRSLVWKIPGVQSASILWLSMSKRRISTYPQEACRAPTEYPVCITDGRFPSGRGTCSSCCRGGRRSLDVVVEALDNVSGARLFEVLRLDSEDVVF